MVIGITGCPGSGKSTLTQYLVQQQWVLIDADRIGKEVVDTEPHILTKLIHEFGPGILCEDGHLDRRKLASTAFENEINTQKLNGIVHPALIAQLQQKITENRLAGNDVVVDCALIFEWDIQDLFDYIVTVAAPLESRISRIKSRDGRSDEDIIAIMNAQLPESVKKERADIVLKNTGSIPRLKQFGNMLAHLSD